MCLNYYY
jgi:hypothetical protein